MTSSPQPILISETFLANHQQEDQEINHSTPHTSFLSSASRQSQLKTDLRDHNGDNNNDNNSQQIHYTTEMLTLLNAFPSFLPQHLPDGIDIELPTTPPLAVKIIFENELPFHLIKTTQQSQSFQSFIQSQYLTARIIIIIVSSSITMSFAQKLQKYIIQPQTTFIYLSKSNDIPSTLSSLLSRYTPTYQTKAQDRLIQLTTKIMQQDYYLSLLQKSNLPPQSIHIIQSKYPSISSLQHFSLIDELNLLEMSQSSQYQQIISNQSMNQEQNLPIVLDLTSIIVLESLVEDCLVATEHPRMNIYPTDSDSNNQPEPSSTNHDDGIHNYNQYQGSKQSTFFQNQSHNHEFSFNLHSPTHLHSSSVVPGQDFKPLTTPFSPPVHIDHDIFSPLQQEPILPDNYDQNYTPDNFDNEFTNTANLNNNNHNQSDNVALNSNHQFTDVSSCFESDNDIIEHESKRSRVVQTDLYLNDNILKHKQDGGLLPDLPFPQYTDDTFQLAQPTAGGLQNISMVTKNTALEQLATHPQQLNLYSYADQQNQPSIYPTVNSCSTNNNELPHSHQVPNHNQFQSTNAQYQQYNPRTHGYNHPPPQQHTCTQFDSLPLFAQPSTMHFAHHVPNQSNIYPAPTPNWHNNNTPQKWYRQQQQQQHHQHHQHYQQLLPQFPTQPNNEPAFQPHQTTHTFGPNHTNIQPNYTVPTAMTPFSTQREHSRYRSTPSDNISSRYTPTPTSHNHPREQPKTGPKSTVRPLVRRFKQQMNNNGYRF